MLKLVITGTGRCGTGYAAQCLTAIGVPCGHEEIFRPGPEIGTKVAESSWLAPKFMWTCTQKPLVVHLRRDPLETLNSLASLPELWIPDQFNDWGFWLNRQIPHLKTIPKIEDKVTDFFVTWLDLIAPIADTIWYVEELEANDLAVTAFEIGYQMSELDLTKFDSVPKNYNTRPRLNDRGWDFWESRRHGREVKERAKSWGYLQ